MDVNPDGSGQFARVTLRPHVTITAESDAATAERLHERASAMCFIARSVNFPVDPETVIAQTGMVNLQPGARLGCGRRVRYESEIVFRMNNLERTAGIGLSPGTQAPCVDLADHFISVANNRPPHSSTRSISWRS